MSPEAQDADKLAPSNSQIGEPRRVALEQYDAIFIRKDPPFDSDYMSVCLLLDPLVGQVKFVNSPRGLRIISEKLTAFLFSDTTPASLATYQLDDALEFAKQFDKVVLKPSYFGSGTGVRSSSATDPEFKQHLEFILNTEPKGPAIIQEFLPEVKNGDTRLMLLNGEILGAVGRKPPEGDFRANIAQGGSEFAVDINQTQRDIALKVGQLMKEQGIIYAGLDFIGDKFIEVNVTSPTLIRELRRVGGPDGSKLIWDFIETP